MSKVTMQGGIRAAFACAVLALGLVLAISAGLFVPQAFANKVIQAPTRPDGSTMTVSDDITRIHVDKVDEDNREFVVGAKMQIIDKETGKVVDEWTTDETTHEFEKGLDVNKVYILHEVSAPDGYGVIDDVEFVANETEGTGLTLVTTRDDVELTDAYKVTLYEPRKAKEKVVTEERVKSNTVKQSQTPKTGDELLPVAGALAGCAIAACVVLLVSRRRIKGE